MKILHMLSYILLWVGGLNWGLVGLFKLNLINSLLSSVPVAEQAVYVLVGVATLYIIATHKTDCKVCAAK